MKKALENLTTKQKNSIFTTITIAITLILCVSIFQYTKHNNTEKMLSASNDYQKALLNYDSSKDVSDFKQVIVKYPNTAYAIFASWYLADSSMSTSSVTSATLDITKLSVSGKTNYTNAAAILEKSIKDNPKNSLTNITKTRLARVYLELNKTDKAIQTLQSAEAVNSSAYIQMLLGDAYTQKENSQKAKVSYEIAMKLSDNDSDLQKLILKKLNNTK